MCVCVCVCAYTDSTPGNLSQFSFPVLFVLMECFPAITILPRWFLHPENSLIVSLLTRGKKCAAVIGVSAGGGDVKL